MLPIKHFLREFRLTFPAGGPTVWTPDYPQEFRSLFPASAGYVFRPGGDPNTPYQKGYYVVSERRRYDFQDECKRRRSRLAIRPARSVGA